MKLRHLAILSLISFFSIAFLNAAYLQNVPLQLKQADGESIKLFASGDEYYNWLHDERGFTIKQDSDGWYKYVTFDADQLLFTKLIALRDDPAKAGLNPRENLSGPAMQALRQEKQLMMQVPDPGRAPSTGTLNNIVVFIRFSDQSEFGESFGTYNNLFNGSSGNNMQTYFQEVSYGALNIASSFYPTPGSMIVSWQDSNPRAYYSPYNATSNPIGYNGDTERTQREHTLLVNAVIGVRSQIPTSLNLDGDNDGRVDSIVFVVRGGSDGWSDLLWPHKWSLYTQTVYINNKRVYDFNFQLSDFMSYSGNGVLCHEMYHTLGAPDLYHYSSNGISPVGSWDIMEGNTNPPQHMGAYMKSKYGGWISNIPVISSPGTYTLSSLDNSTSNAFRINSPYSSSQYFVVEYRKKSGTFENSLPGSGLLVYRINTAAGDGNASGPPDEVYIYRPGGTTGANGSIDLANFSQETGRTSINQFTNPAPFLENGDNGGLYLHSIGSSSANTITFTYSNVDPSVNIVEGFENGFQTFPWSFSGNANWNLDNSEFYSGNTSARSGAIGHNQSTSMQLTRDIPFAGQISFFYRVSSEANNDFLKFYLNGALQGQWSGTTSWALASYNVSSGTNTFRWEYVKDGTVIGGSDCAWIDHIAWPELTTNPPQNLVAVPGNGIVDLYWDAPATGTPSAYKVYRNNAFLAQTSSLSYTDTGLINGLGYTYYVTALFGAPNLETSASNVVEATPYQYSSVNIGSGNIASSTTSGSPICIYYRNSHGQSIYGASELIAAGMSGSVTITHIGFNIVAAPTQALPNFIIRMKHSTASNVLNWQSAEGMVTVYSATTYVPTAGGFEMLTLSTPFVWNGVDNLVIDTAFGATASWHSSGSVQCTSVTNGYRYTWNDNTVQTDIFTGGSVHNNRPNIRLTYVEALATPEISVNTTALDFGMVMLNTPETRSFEIQNNGQGVLSGTINAPGAFTVSLPGRTTKVSETQNISQIPERSSPSMLLEKQKSLQRNTLAFDIPGGSSATYSISFLPTAVQNYSGNLVISHNAEGGDQIINLNAQGGKPTIAVSATNFSINLAPGQLSNHNFTISNNGNMALEYSLAPSQNTAWLLINNSPIHMGTIAVGEAAHGVQLSYNATDMAPGTYSATVVCSSNDPANPTINININLTVRIPISISAPLAGANWTGGSRRNIVFGYSGTGNSVQLFYSFDNGNTWQDGGAITTVYGSNTYSWVVPNYPSSTCKIKLVDSVNPFAERLGNTFSISAPANPLITILSPSLGDIWETDSIQHITWTHNLMHPNVRLYYSWDDGTQWQYIDTVPVTDLSYAWLIPDTPSSQGRIKIVDALDEYAFATSAIFALEIPLPLLPPQDIQILRWGSDGAISISWSAASGNPSAYLVYRSDTPDFVSAILLATVPASQTEFMDTQTGNRYFYKVIAIRQ